MVNDPDSQIWVQIRRNETDRLEWLLLARWESDAAPNAWHWDEAMDCWQAMGGPLDERPFEQRSAESVAVTMGGSAESLTWWESSALQ